MVYYKSHGLFAYSYLKPCKIHRYSVYNRTILGILVRLSARLMLRVASKPCFCGFAIARTSNQFDRNSLQNSQIANWILLFLCSGIIYTKPLSGVPECCHQSNQGSRCIISLHQCWRWLWCQERFPCIGEPNFHTNG